MNFSSKGTAPITNSTLHSIFSFSTTLRKKALLPEKPPPPFPHTAKVAAALSAAVTTTKQQEAAPTLQAEPPMQKKPRRTPAALRERGYWGRGASLREAPLPQHLPPPVSSGESAREGASLQRSPLPRIYHIFNPTVSLTGSEKAWACSPVCSRTAAHTALKISFLMSAGTSIKISSFSGCTVIPKIFF